MKYLNLILFVAIASCNLDTQIENRKVVTGEIKELRNSKTGFFATVEYSFNDILYRKTKTLDCIYCYHLNQSIMLEIDSLNPSDFDFIRDTLFNKGKLNADGTNITDTLIARNFEFNEYSKCLYFDLYKDNILISRFSKLVNSKPADAEMLFIYYGADMYENELKLK